MAAQKTISADNVPLATAQAIGTMPISTMLDSQIAKAVTAVQTTISADNAPLATILAIGVMLSLIMLA
jgi:hypothetical protein